MADTRQYDLELLARERLKAKNSYQRDKIDRLVASIGRENGAVRERREQLVMAVRHNDHRAIRRLQHDLNMMKADETYGKAY